MNASDLQSTALFDKAAGCLAGAAMGDAAGAGGGAGFDACGDETAMVEIVAQMLAATGGRATLDDWARALRNHSPRFGKDSEFFISVRQVCSAVGRSSYPPRCAGLGTMPHSTAAAAMGPVGIVNACNPRQAALQAYELAALMHLYDVGFCQDAAAAVAGAVAAACCKDATVTAVLDAAVEVILPTSGAEMADLIGRARELAAEAGDFETFRDQICRYRRDEWLRPLAVDPRETVPVALAIFALADGDVERSVACAAGFGRAGDTIGALAGTVSGAFSGAAGIDAGRLTGLQAARTTQRNLAGGLVSAARRKRQALRSAAAALRAIAG